jgi:aminoglycoside 6'-N-acetyltransferase
MQPRGRLLASGVRRAGESLYAAAVRLARERAGPIDVRPWAVDLSARPAVFGVDGPAESPDQPADPSRMVVPSTGVEPRESSLEVRESVPGPVIGFRAMTRADFPDVVRWVNEPHVACWWDDESGTMEKAERHYGPALDGRDPTRMWVVEVNGRSVGFVQDYRIGDHPDWALLTARPDAVGFDYAIGEPSWVGRGVGTRMLWTFLRDVVRPHYPDASTYFAAPDHRNAASLRVLDKLGFTQGLWFDEPQPDGRIDTVVSCTLDVRRVFG